MIKNIIATLGPEGTCSEMAANYYGKKTFDNFSIELYNTFESAVDSLKDGKSTAVIIPSAYKKLSKIIFREKEFIALKDVFIFDTPEIVFAMDYGNNEINSIASQSSPLYLIKDKFDENIFVESNSNSRSALMVKEGLADACLTTKICADKYSMKIINNFGHIHMGWNVFTLNK